MYTVLRTSEFLDWLNGQRDFQLKDRIRIRLSRVENGNLGDSKSIGNNLFELRITYGPGYRIYYTKRNNTIIILLCGGDKSTQSIDIAYAKKLEQEVDL